MVRRTFFNKPCWIPGHPDYRDGLPKNLRLLTNATPANIVPNNKVTAGSGVGSWAASCVYLIFEISTRAVAGVFRPFTFTLSAGSNTTSNEPW